MWVGAGGNGVIDRGERRVAVGWGRGSWKELVVGLLHRNASDRIVDFIMM